ncbi:hypothetical protein BLNAU_10847 [Blattamonas nauphoetae]|uniref:Uncharacterized protein n=1 Tax=Blattamonas nauphoetae TaxID=2049346 RepID=A0ABQ9XSN0_9EUKA|nr:hypothetical protein BLNAU_10847 [Blattamonas nauphoetae]
MILPRLKHFGSLIPGQMPALAAAHSITPNPTDEDSQKNLSILDALNDLLGRMVSTFDDCFLRSELSHSGILTSSDFRQQVARMGDTVDLICSMSIGTFDRASAGTRLVEASHPNTIASLHHTLISAISSVVMPLDLISTSPPAAQKNELLSVRKSLDSILNKSWMVIGNTTHTSSSDPSAVRAFDTTGSVIWSKVNDTIRVGSLVSTGSAVFALTRFCSLHWTRTVSMMREGVVPLLMASINPTGLSPSSFFLHEYLVSLLTVFFLLPDYHPNTDPQLIDDVVSSVFLPSRSYINTILPSPILAFSVVNQLESALRSFSNHSQTVASFLSEVEIKILLHVENTERLTNQLTTTTDMFTEETEKSQRREDWTRIRRLCEMGVEDTMEAQVVRMANDDFIFHFDTAVSGLDPFGVNLI